MPFSSPQVKRVLFLCSHNSARSQMAEGLLRWLGGDSYEALSAGTRATQVRPEAVAVMREIGVDIGGQSSKSLDRYLPEEIDVVVTVCDEANEECPVFLNARRRMHWSIDDPARAGGTEAERLSAFRKARDNLRNRIEAELLGMPLR